MIRVQRIGTHKLPVPARGSRAAAGYDLATRVDALIAPGAVAYLPTGFAWELNPSFSQQCYQQIPADHFMGRFGLIRDRSSIAGLGGIVVAGVIDADYRGEIVVMMYNSGKDELRFKVGDRVAQLILIPVRLPDLIEAEQLTQTQRGQKGFGSTGA